MVTTRTNNTHGPAYPMSRAIETTAWLKGFIYRWHSLYCNLTYSSCVSHILVSMDGYSNHSWCMSKKTLRVPSTVHATSGMVLQSTWCASYRLVCSIHIRVWLACWISFSHSSHMSMSYSVAWGCAMLSHIPMIVMRMQLVHLVSRWAAISRVGVLLGCVTMRV